jgi:hypothetical protein
MKTVLRKGLYESIPDRGTAVEPHLACSETYRSVPRAGTVQIRLPTLIKVLVELGLASRVPPATAVAGGHRVPLYGQME